MIVAIGAFDGFHRGHMTLIERSREIASRTRMPWGIITFDRHPEGILGEGDFHCLFLPAEQELLRRYFHVPVVHRVTFTRKTAGMAPEAFLDDIAARWGVKGIVVGRDFRFGRGRAGTLELLAAECARRAWSLDIMPLLCYDELPLSSSRIRDAVMSGDMRGAWNMLGYPFFCACDVIHGEGRGHRLGFPTANLRLPDEKVRPRTGVYAALVRACDSWYPGAVSIGSNPTFAGQRALAFEVNIIGFEGDLYGANITVFLLKRLRDERKFSGAETLLEQVRKDVADTEVCAREALAAERRMWDNFAECGSCSSSSSVI